MKKHFLLVTALLTNGCAFAAETPSTQKVILDPQILTRDMHKEILCKIDDPVMLRRIALTCSYWKALIEEMELKQELNPEMKKIIVPMNYHHDDSGCVSGNQWYTYVNN